MFASAGCFLSVSTRTLVVMARVRTVPVWVRPPAAVVASTEDFLLWVYGRTNSPEALGSRSALGWIGGLDVTAPLSSRSEAPSQRRALSEFMLASRVSEQEPYPEVAWWREQGYEPGQALPHEWWEANSGYGVSRAYAQGIALALGWAFGTIDDPTLLTPIHRDDGSEIPTADRAEYARVLRKLSDRTPVAGAHRPASE